MSDAQLAPQLRAELNLDVKMCDAQHGRPLK